MKLKNLASDKLRSLDSPSLCESLLGYMCVAVKESVHSEPEDCGSLGGGPGSRMKSAHVTSTNPSS